MTRPVLGLLAGGVLGLIDGMSAWFYPEARAMMVPIVIGSTIKGLFTGLAVGLVARWKQSAPLGMLTGAVVGFILSSLAAIGQPDQYWVIVLPGMFVGIIAGVLAQRGRSAATALCFAVMLPIGLSAQQAAPPSPLSAVQPFVGKWAGTSEGQPGTGTLTREYRLILRDRFLEETNRSVYPAQDKNPKGETHEHRSFFSFDRARNIPNGYRARETYTFINPNEFEEVFEIAEPGKEFELYSRARLRRVP